MRRSRDRHSQGFTIVEVLIVLAIAGLILLIVFEAIPTLERNSRNDQRKRDVAVILQAVSHYELNNGGTLPPNVPPNSPLIFLANTSLAYYVLSDISITAETPGSVPAAIAGTSIDSVDIYNYFKCNSDTSAASSTGAGYLDVVAVYELESSNGATIPQCQQL